mgnify:CR=1 FL=1
MRKIKKFKVFLEENSPSREPEVHPGTKPTRRDKPSRPSPIRRDKPAVKPDPKAEQEPVKASAQDVIDRFAEITNQKK